MKRGWLASGVLAAILALVVLAMISPAGASAKEEHPAAAKEGGEGGHPHEEQPNFFKGLVDLSIWTIVVFMLLLFVLGKFAWPMMLEGLEKRERAVASALEKAREAQADAERIQTELDRKYKQANDEIRTMMEEARRSAHQSSEEMLAKARADIQAERDRQRREIGMAHDQALQDIWKQASQLATLVSAKAIRRQLTEEDHRRLVSEALTELQQAARERQQVVAELS